MAWLILMSSHGLLQEKDEESSLFGDLLSGDISGHSDEVQVRVVCAQGLCLPSFPFSLHVPFPPLALCCLSPRHNHGCPLVLGISFG